MCPVLRQTSRIRVRAPFLTRRERSLHALSISQDGTVGILVFCVFEYCIPHSDKLVAVDHRDARFGSDVHKSYTFGRELRRDRVLEIGSGCVPAFDSHSAVAASQASTFQTGHKLIEVTFRSTMLLVDASPIGTIRGPPRSPGEPVSREFRSRFAPGDLGRRCGGMRMGMEFKESVKPPACVSAYL